MRKVIVAAFISVDGVMQAPGGPEEDPTGGFEFGGWQLPVDDPEAGEEIGRLFEIPIDLLLGRTTYDIFAAYWPYVAKDESDPAFNAENANIGRLFDKAVKYVATHRPDDLNWANSQALGSDIVAAITALKAQDGPDLLTHGSTQLVHQMLAAGLVDDLRVFTYPLLLGRGKRLFDDKAAPTTLKPVKVKATSGGVLCAVYQPAGPVKTASMTKETPSPAELERRRNLR